MKRCRLEELFPLHDPWLGPCYRAVIKSLRRPYDWDPADIDDMANQVGLELHNLQQQHKIRTTPQQILQGIASNVVKNDIRKRTQRRKHLQRYFEEPRPNSLMIEKPVPDVWKRLHAVVRRLLSDSLRGFFDYFTETRDFAPADAAREFAIKPNAADKRASRIRKTLLSAYYQMNQSLDRLYGETRSPEAEDQWLTLSLTNKEKLAKKCFIASDLVRLCIPSTPSIIYFFTPPSKPLTAVECSEYTKRVRPHARDLAHAHFTDPVLKSLQASLYGFLGLIGGKADRAALEYVSAMRELCLVAPPEIAVDFYREFFVVSAAYLNASERDRALRVLKQQPWPESLRAALSGWSPKV